MDCTCTYCYHNVCFHPQRGDEASLGVLCDGCNLEDVPQVVPESALALTTLLQ